MNTENTDNNPEDKEFDELLTDLYHISLFDEDFQQQVIQDIKQLPTENRALLNTRTQAFIEDKEPPAELVNAVLADIATNNEAQPQSSQQHKKNILQKLFNRKKRSFSWLSPTVTVPTSLAFGILFGVILAPLLNTNEIRHVATRGGASQKAESTKEIDASTQAIIKEQNNRLEEISSLILDREIEEAEQQLKQFKKDYPNFQPKQ